MEQQMNPQGNSGEPEHKKGTIVIGGPSKPKEGSSQMSDVVSEVNTFATRIRSTEERMNNLRRSYQMNEQNFIELNKKINQEISNINGEIFDLKKGISDIKTKMELIIKELMLTAKKEDVDVLNKYLDLWKPVDFVTQNEVRKIVKRVLYEIGLNIRPEEFEKEKTERNESNSHSYPEKPFSELPEEDENFGIHRRL